LLQPVSLIWDSLVHSLPQLRLDFLELCPHAVAPGLPLAESEAKRPPIPTESGHPIRSKAAT
jgi:hypothetical protein